ncbi:MAG TPA: DUF5666 domain-containing protein [Candidatus Moranbacteria bacterium]|nr:DUF5666 domain-containing protein [Candidatus Moranbacteria bacterium]
MPQDKKNIGANYNFGETNAKNRCSIFRKAVVIFAGLFILALIFNAVVFIVNVKRDRWAGDQYFGKIIEINSDIFTIQGRSNEKKEVLIDGNTVVKKGAGTVKDALKVGDEVIVFGRLNEKGQIESRLIRVFDQNDRRNPGDFWPHFSR